MVKKVQHQFFNFAQRVLPWIRGSKTKLGAPNLKSRPQDERAKVCGTSGSARQGSLQHLSNLMDIPIKFSCLRIRTITTSWQPFVKNPALLKQELW